MTVRSEDYHKLVKAIKNYRYRRRPIPVSMYAQLHAHHIRHELSRLPTLGLSDEELQIKLQLLNEYLPRAFESWHETMSRPHPQRTAEQRAKKRERHAKWRENKRSKKDGNIT